MPMSRERQWIDVHRIKNDPPPDYVGLAGFPSLQRYANYSFLGAGAFGRVYAAVHAEIGRVEAVKRIEIRDPRQRQMALAEAETLARFPPHPNLVTLFNAEADNHSLYLMLQYIDGVPADALSLPLPIGQALALVRDTAQALSLVHSHNIIHRDIKPANLFCTRTGTGVVGDFGVARARDSTAGTAAIAGSPGYMSPEALQGRAGPASDLWSLGVMLYELLTGHRPFESVESLPIAELPRALMETPWKLPSALRPEIPQGVDDLVAMLLAIRPENRPPSAMEVVDLLPRYNTVVSIRSGDLVAQNVDAIVYTANERLLMTKPGSLDKQILLQAGTAMLDEAQRQSPARVGSAVVTRGGDLAARYIFHAIGLHIDHHTGREQPVQERDLRRALWSCFRKAHEMRLRTIALPAMGTSTGNTPEDAARMLVDVTHTYLLEFRPPLEQVIFVLRDRSMSEAFREAAAERGMLLV